MSRIARRLVLLLCVSAPSGLSGQAAVPRWTVDETPIRQLGSATVPTVELGTIVGVVLGRDGSLAVADQGAQTIHLLSPDGRQLRSVGRRGSGPGEFRSLSGLAAAGDTLIAIENPPGVAQLQRFVDGRYLDGMLLQSEDSRGQLSAIARFQDGALLVQPGGFTVATPPPLGTLRRDSSALGVFSTDTPRRVSWFGRFPGVTWMAFELPGEPGRTTMGTQTLAATLVMATSGELAWIGDSETGRIRLVSSGGDSIRTLRLPTQRRPFDSKAIERARDADLEAATSEFARARVQEKYRARSRPDSAPHFSRFVAGEQGTMWIQLFEADPSRPSEWLVFDATGRQLARTILPAGFKLWSVARDTIAGVQTSEDGDESVRVLRLRTR